MNLIVACMIVSCILAGYAALDLMPQTPEGRTAAFAIWLITVYPLDRLMASTKDRPWWHHWFGSAFGVVVVYIGYTLTAQGVISDDLSFKLNIVVGALVVGSLLYYYAKKRRQATR